ncbi:hypothetical protein [Aeromonas phage 4L372XY]|uniref:Uncharacterized protein n=1 Tax=Aeromonas phage 4L372XY TaxID=2588520 RepID=A0A5B9NBQ6_9CAUD|nr:hypothetical protein HWC28_gp166 [Aeromonas phage 4L372XY]QEG08881.1 hypothetical protein [Aeromonas phage 4L372XY]
MKLLSVDQSTAKFAYVLWDDNIPISRSIIRTGKSDCKKQIDSVNYFDTTIEQIIYIVENFIGVVKQEKPDVICCEGLAFGAMGDQTRNLAGLYFCMLYKLKELGYTEGVNFHVVTPTKNKAYARTLLPEPINKKEKKVKMDKKKMIELAEETWPDMLAGLKNSGKDAGREDVADALHIGRYVYDVILQKENK